MCSVHYTFTLILSVHLEFTLQVKNAPASDFRLYSSGHQWSAQCRCSAYCATSDLMSAFTLLTIRAHCTYIVHYKCAHRRTAVILNTGNAHASVSCARVQPSTTMRLKAVKYLLVFILSRSKGAQWTNIFWTMQENSVLWLQCVSRSLSRPDMSKRHVIHYTSAPTGADAPVKYPTCILDFPIQSSLQQWTVDLAGILWRY